MSKFFGKRKTSADRISKEIDQQIKAFDRKERGKHKILMLGTGESGKTTILKQMQILHINDFTLEEKLEKVIDIRRNIHDSIYQIVSNMKKVKPAVNVDNIHGETKKLVKYILSLGPGPLRHYNQNYYDAVDQLWKDPEIQKVARRGNEFHLLDSTEEFMKRLGVIRRDDYVPTTQDILYCRVKTTTIKELEFSVKVKEKYGGGSTIFRMFDVGGQQGYRKKWITVFEGIETVLFVISMSDFDQVLRENDATNRLEEALTNFDNMFNSRYLQSNNAIIFLNKEDMLQKKIQNGVSIGTYFAQYKSFQKSPDELLNTKLFIKHEVDAIIKSGLTDRTIFTHFTTATNTENIKNIFDDVHIMLIDKALQNVMPY